MKPRLRSFTVRVPPELIRRIHLAAFKESMSMQEWVTDRLTGILDFEENPYHEMKLK